MVANPAIASSTLLSTISRTRWNTPSGPVVPMYIPGRLRTASKPSITVMSSAVYFSGSGVSVAARCNSGFGGHTPPSRQLSRLTMRPMAAVGRGFR